MVRHLGSALTDITYVFDEPTVGLHPHDIERMNDLLEQLRDKGNTVLVVEHKPEVIAHADHIVDIGPGAGTNGGEIVYEGDLAGLRKSGTITGRYLDHRMELRPEVRQGTGVLEIRGASLHNLKDVSVDIPTGVLTVVTGVAGSGKSSLIHGSLAGRDGILVVDQSAIKGSRRSNPATYRAARPDPQGPSPRLTVSTRLLSATPEVPAHCNGVGQVFASWASWRPSRRREECEGSVPAEVLECAPRPQYRRGAADVGRRAAEVFTTGPAATILDGCSTWACYLARTAADDTSGGAATALAASMTEGASTYILDEPTSGLHLADTERLVTMLHGLVDAGHTVIVIEHNLAVIAQADHIIDIGPGAGHDGGELVFQGAPAEMVADSDTLTAQHLRAWISP